MKKFFALVIVLSSITGLACSSSSSSGSSNGCPAAGPGKCSADPAITDGEVSGCNQDLSDPKCGSAYKAYLDCYNQNVKCNSSNQTDEAALSQACGSQQSAFTSCASGSSTDAGK